MRIMFLLLILLILTASCKVSEISEPKKELSELQIEACNSAHETGTCDTKLEELGIVIKEDCCEVLGKCC